MSVDDPNPQIAAHSLKALFDARDPQFLDAARTAANRTETIHVADGCFAWSGTLAEYARDLSEEYTDAVSDDAGDEVTPEKEAAWLRTEFEEILGKIMTGKTMSRHPYSEHSQLAELAKKIGQRDVLQKLLEVTRHLVIEMPPASRIVIAETLVGRNSPIELARALGDASLANEFSELVPVFCETAAAMRDGRPLEERKAAVFSRLQEVRAP